MGQCSQFAGALRRALCGNVLVLGIVSFFTDVGSEMVYPLLPAFFAGLVPTGLAAVYVGLMDGIAESTSSLLKVYAGHLSDRLHTRKPLALAGYALSSLVRPLNALAGVGWHIVALRFMDRVGKGFRTAPRDALLSETVDDDVRGLAFSIHRLMDHAGAVVGPLVATGLLYATLGAATLWQQGSEGAAPSSAEMGALRIVFALSLLPGVVATLALWRWVSDAPAPIGAVNGGRENQRPSLPRRFYVFLGAVVLFTLGNSSDLFIIFYAQTRFGLGLGWVIGLWVLLHLSKALFSMPGGRLSDLYGRRRAIITGWVLYVAVYVTLPLVGALPVFCALLVVYGVYYGLTEGAERALVADAVAPDARGTAYGVYHGAVGLAALPASLLFGVFWAVLGPQTAFLIGASLAAGAVGVLVIGSSGNVSGDDGGATPTA